MVVNGRLVRDARLNLGDYKNTADRPAEFYPVEGEWEAIPTTNESYGYSKFDSSHKPVSFFVRLLATAVSRGGNLLLNIGPMGNGVFDPRDSAILQGIGEWMRHNKTAIYGAGKSGMPLQSWGVTTLAAASGNSAISASVASSPAGTLYLHVFDWPSDGRLYLGGLKNKVSIAWLLKDPSLRSLPITRLNDKDLYIQVPKRAPDGDNTVIALRLRDAIRTDSVRYIAPNASLSRLLAYDASLQGGPFGFGDGKRDRYYVDGWKSDSQTIRWTFRTGEPASFKVVFKYLAGGNNNGVFQWQLDSFRQEEQVITAASGEAGTVTTQEAGVVAIGAGIHTLTLKPVRIDKGELMKLLEAQLIRQSR